MPRLVRTNPGREKTDGDVALFGGDCNKRTTSPVNAAPVPNAMASLPLTQRDRSILGLLDAAGKSLRV